MKRTKRANLENHRRQSLRPNPKKNPTLKKRKRRKRKRKISLQFFQQCFPLLYRRILIQRLTRPRHHLIVQQFTKQIILRSPQQIIQLTTHQARQQTIQQTIQRLPHQSLHPHFQQPLHRLSPPTNRPRYLYSPK